MPANAGSGALAHDPGVLLRASDALSGRHSPATYGVRCGGDRADPAHQRQAIQTRLAALTPPLTEDAPLLTQLLGIPLAPEELPALSPEARRRRLQHVCLQGLMQQAADSPLGLLVEDGPWLDPSSQEL